MIPAALSLALWIAIAAQLDAVAYQIEKRAPAAAHALRQQAEQLRRFHAGR